MSSDTRPVPGSFRDPAGRLYERDGVLYRTVRADFAPQFRAFMDSGLYGELVDEGLLVAHQEADPATAPEACTALILPERVTYVSHPWEWSPGQLRAAALLTLELQLRALERGLILRDASAFNVQFRGHRPVFIDTLSFGTQEPDRPWAAYGQFCRHFLAPLALRVLVDPRLDGLQQTHLDGVPLDLASGLLPGRTRLSPGLLLHLHGHAKAQRRRAASADDPPRTARYSRTALLGLTDQLRRQVERLRWDPDRSVWADYYAAAGHYTDDAMAVKAHIVGEWLARLRPSQVVDLGANTGRFARLAAAVGAEVVAADVDHGAVEAAYRQLVDDPPASGSVLPLRVDLANPGPASGWDHRERAAFRDRVGGADVVLALALVHHLAIGNDVPLDQVMATLAGYGRQVIIEWVPPEDPKVRTLLATRPERAGGYLREAFDDAVAAVGRVVASEPVAGTGRVLLLVEVS